MHTRRSDSPAEVRCKPIAAGSESLEQEACIRSRVKPSKVVALGVEVNVANGLVLEQQLHIASLGVWKTQHDRSDGPPTRHSDSSRIAAARALELQSIRARAESQLCLKSTPGNGA